MKQYMSHHVVKKFVEKFVGHHCDTSMMQVRMFRAEYQVDYIVKYFDAYFHVVFIPDNQKYLVEKLHQHEEYSLYNSLKDNTESKWNDDSDIEEV